LSSDMKPRNSIATSTAMTGPNSWPFVEPQDSRPCALLRYPPGDER
jgi:hypothetical protein